MSKLDGFVEKLRIFLEMSVLLLFLLGCVLLALLHSAGYLSAFVPALVGAFVAIVVLLVDLQGLWKVREAMAFRDTAQVTAETRRYAPVAEGSEVVMPFRRHRFRWTSEHIPGSVLRSWEFRGDALGDRVFCGKQAYHPVIVEDGVGESSQGAQCPVLAGGRVGEGVEAELPTDGKRARRLGPAHCSVSEFERRLQAEGRVNCLPDWVDFELLDVGCAFFATTWPFVSYQFAWAVMGGFGAEQASAVLLRSRYWAANGPTGRIDTWRRLRETLCFLHDICAHGADGFRPDGVSLKACLYVRWLHCRARANIWNSRQPWDYCTLGEPINQAELIGTLIGSSLLLLDGLEETAFFQAPVPPKCRAGFLHLWAVVGHLFGIEEDLNPCRDEKRCRITMESLFTFGIPEHPKPELTHAVCQHVLSSVADGIAFTMGGLAKVLAPSSATVAMPAWLFLGKQYGTAVGLPAPSTLDLTMGWMRRITLGVVLCCYLRLLNAVQQGKGDQEHMLEGACKALMRRLFAAAVRQVRADQPSCRFGVVK